MVKKTATENIYVGIKELININSEYSDSFSCFINVSWNIISILFGKGDQ